MRCRDSTKCQLKSLESFSINFSLASPIHQHLTNQNEARKSSQSKSQISKFVSGFEGVCCFCKIIGRKTTYQDHFRFDSENKITKKYKNPVCDTLSFVKIMATQREFLAFFISK